MNKDTFKIIIFSLALFLFLGMLFNGSFAPDNVIAPGEFETVGGEDSTSPDTNNPDYSNITTEQQQIADRAIGGLLNNPDYSFSPSMINVVSVEEVEFGDSSLGCPVDGQFYSQVITPGYKIVLEAGGETFDYRLDKAETVNLCKI